MCLAAFSLQASAEYSLVFAANRDELHERPTTPAGWWDEPRAILGGRDLVAGGSWLAIDRSGRLAAVTNFREISDVVYSNSRGRLVQDYLNSSVGAEEYLAGLDAHATDYGPFNLLIFDGQRLHYASNRAPGQELDPGVYALSNTHLGSTWPKVSHAEARLTACLDSGDLSACLFDLLADRTLHGDLLDPDDRESRLKSTIFLQDDHYGTRASTVVLLSRNGELRFIERRFDADGTLVGETSESFDVIGADPASD
jgi:uncharacterized protein with NRDE domain